MIDDSAIQFSRELVELARKHGVASIDTTFHFSWKPGTVEQHGLAFQNIRCSWAQGRHGDSGRIKLDWNQHVDVSEKDDAAKEGSRG